MFRKNEDKPAQNVDNDIFAIDPENQDAKVINEALNTLFSSDPSKIIQTSRFRGDDSYISLSDVATAETVFNQLILKHCDISNVMRARDLIDTFYRATVSENGEGRKEVFKMLTPQHQFIDMDRKKRRWPF